MGQIAVIVRSAKERKDAPFFLSTKSVGKSHIPIQKDVLVAGLAVQKSGRIFPDRPSRRPHNLTKRRAFLPIYKIRWKESHTDSKGCLGRRTCGSKKRENFPGQAIEAPSQFVPLPKIFVDTENFYCSNQNQWDNRKVNEKYRRKSKHTQPLFVTTQTIAE